MTFNATLASGLIGATLALSFNAATVAEDYASLVREQRAVMVGGVRESWRLQWESAPLPACGTEDLEVALGCQCTGFAYGEAGRPTLVRLRPGHPAERLELAPFFKDQGAPGPAGTGVLAHWRPIPAAAHDEEDDWHHAADFDFLKRVQARGPVELLEFGDYNHDGRASEFLLQVGLRPCGRPQLVLIGVSARNPHLHVFASAEAPDQPLMLPAAAWAAVLASPRPTHTVEASCADPDSTSEAWVDVAARHGVFHVRRESRACPRAGAH